MSLSSFGLSTKSKSLCDASMKLRYVYAQLIETIWPLMKRDRTWVGGYYFCFFFVFYSNPCFFGILTTFSVGLITSKVPCVDTYSSLDYVSLASSLVGSTTTESMFSYSIRGLLNFEFGQGVASSFVTVLPTKSSMLFTWPSQASSISASYYFFYAILFSCMSSCF